MDDFPFKLIVPAIFLVFWVLNQLFGQENKAAPAPAKGQPLGPRPPGRMPPAPRPSTAPVVRDPTLRWPSPSESGGVSVRRPTPSGAEEILIIRPEAPPRPGGGGTSARRPKANSSAGAKRAEPAKARPLISAVAPSTAQGLDQSSGPVSPAPTSASAAKTAAASPAAPMVTTQGPVASPSLSGLLLAARSPSQLRDAIILSELLQPPVALRTPRRR